MLKRIQLTYRHDVPEGKARHWEAEPTVAPFTYDLPDGEYLLVPRSLEGVNIKAATDAYRQRIQMWDMTTLECEASVRAVLVAALETEDR